MFCSNLPRLRRLWDSLKRAAFLCENRQPATRPIIKKGTIVAKKISKAPGKSQPGGDVPATSEGGPKPSAPGVTKLVVLGTDTYLLAKVGPAVPKNQTFDVHITIKRVPPESTSTQLFAIQDCLVACGCNVKCGILGIG
jgi:hypothetical protein